MAMVCRIPTLEDLPALLEIEGKSTPKLRYLADVQEEFFDPAYGEMILCEEDGVPIGFAHLSRQYDGAAWLECLRVAPEHQKKGCGALIWKKVIQLCEEWKAPALRMYTGATNYASRVLGERNGLSIALTTMEGVLTAENAPEAAAPEFAPVDCPVCAEKAMHKYADGYQGYFCMNRTFYRMGEGLYRGLQEEGMVCTGDGFTLVLGERFQGHLGLHLGLLGGDADAAARAAVAALKASGRPKLVCMLPQDRTDLAAALEKYGMVFPESRIIMLERRF